MACRRADLRTIRGFVRLRLIDVAVILTVGMSWAHLRRRLSGQATVGEVGN